MTDEDNPPRRKNLRTIPANTDKSRMRLRVTFDKSENALPVLGDLVRAKRGEYSRKAAAEEAGVGAHVILDIESYHSARQEEISRLLIWVGYTPRMCQTPPPIAHRAFGRTKLTANAEGIILEDILQWLAEGNALSKYESVRFQIDAKRAKKLVTRNLRSSPEFRVAHAQAIAVGAYNLVGQIIEIADDSSISPAQASNMIKARQWIASKYNAPQFGGNAETNVNVNVGFGEHLEKLERRRQNGLPAPLRVIDVEPLELQNTTVIENRSSEVVDD